MKVSVQALSSSGGSYKVEFTDDTGILRVFCYCQAGQLQQMCKHKLALLKGDVKMLYDPAEEKALHQVLASPTYPALKKRLDVYENEIAEVERGLARLKQQEKRLKSDFAYELTHGMRKG